MALDAASGAISGTPSLAGTFSPTFTVRDAYGTRASEAITLRAVSPTPAEVTAPPRLTALTQSAGHWALGTKLPSLTSTTQAPARRSGLPVGTTFSFRLDHPARVKLAFRYLVSGRRVSGTCVARRPRNAHRPYCTRILGVGVLSVLAHAGMNRLHFDGRISARSKLKAGSYGVFVTATNPAGKTSPPHSLRFTTSTE